MSVKVIGISHHTAPLEIRERFVFDTEQTQHTLDQIVAEGMAGEGVLLSTCNRTELYTVGDGGDARVRTMMLEQLCERAGIALHRAETLFYEEHERAAIEHLFRVSASLDSMILGEPQIQGQVRDAYEVACAVENGTRRVGPVLARLFETALSVGGRVRSQTGLGIGAASIPSAAVELARKIFGSLKEKTAAVLGTGEMGRLALDCLQAEGVTDAAVVGRANIEDLQTLLTKVDIVITATAAPHTVITNERAQAALPRGRRHPLLIVDIALPRDVDPAVGEIENVFLYNLDDLQQVVDSSLERRKKEIPVAEAIVQQAVAEFWQWYRGLDVVPLIRQLREHAENIRREEVERAMRNMKHLSPADAAAVEALTKQILSKVLHRPTVGIKQLASESSEAGVLRTMRNVFGLGDPDSGDNGQ